MRIASKVRRVYIYLTRNPYIYIEIEEFWLDQIKDKVDKDAKIILIGNKVDLYKSR